MISAGVLREGPTVPEGPGRPAVPLEIDPDQRQVLGVAIETTGVRAVPLNLHGVPSGQALHQPATGEDLVPAAARVLQQAISQRLLGVGVSIAGFADLESRHLLMSSANPRQKSVSLEPLFAAAGELPLIVANDLQAMAVQWTMTHQATDCDTLLVFLSDGAIGAAVLIDGELNHGCITGGNELGHTRYPVQTELCYCGHVGCLERICSTAFYVAQPEGTRAATLGEAVARFNHDDPALQQIVDHLARGVSNAINLLRPHRLVLAGGFTAHAVFTNDLLDATRAGCLAALTDRVRIELWEQATVDFARAAAWLPLAQLFRGG
jgi:predicted NBD/HSP70 family sugar kinase